MQKYKKNELKITTVDSYIGMYRRHIKDSVFGKIKIDKVITEVLQRYYNNKIKSGYSSKTVREIEILVQGFLETQKLYKCYRGIRASHEWVLFNLGETLDGYGRNQIIDIVYQFALWYFQQGFQVVFAIHIDTEYSYIHYVINSVNFITGRKYSLNTRILLKNTQSYSAKARTSSKGMCFTPHR